MSKTSTAIVGRRLRRFLGALLAAGFGVTWWSLVPPAAASSGNVEVVQPKVTTAKVAPTPPRIVLLPVPIVIAQPPHKPTPVATRPMPRRPRFAQPPPSRQPIVVEPRVVPIVTPPPVIEPPPVVIDVPPITDVPVPNDEPVVVRDEPIRLPPIRTRPS